jgi:hypothetical protein
VLAIWTRVADRFSRFGPEFVVFWWAPRASARLLVVEFLAARSVRA